MSCEEESIVVPGAVLADCDPFRIGCLLQTDGEPGADPAEDKLPFAYDPTTGCLWQFVCDDGWTSFCPPTPIDPLGCIPTTSGMPTVDAVPGESQIQYDPATKCLWFFICGTGWTTGKDQFEPITIDTPVIYSGRCYGPIVLSTNLLDSRDGSFTHATTPPDSVIMFTNPTNQTGVLTFNVTFWWGLFDGQGNSNDRASIAFMMGRKTITDTFDFDEDSLGGIADTPYIQEDISFDERVFPTEHVYRFWGVGPVACPTCISGRSQSATLTKDFILTAGETIELDVMMGLGFEITQTTSTGWFGNHRRLTFTGHNKVN